MKYRVRCQAATGEIIHEYFINASYKIDAQIKHRKSPEYDKSAMMAYEKEVFEYQYVIDNVNDLN